MDEIEKGALIFKRFYGPLAQTKLYLYLLVILIPFLDSCTIWLYYTNQDNPIKGVFFIVILILSLIAPIMIVLAILYSTKKYPNSIKMHFSGELEWDTYEKGIMTKNYSLTGPGNIETRFFPFGDMSRVIIYPQRHKIDEIFELYKAMVREKNPEGSGTNERLSRGKSQNISNMIWFVDSNGKLVDLAMQRYFLRPGTRSKFKELLRQKVKVVE